MLKLIGFISLLLFSFPGHTQLVNISGFAPAYVGSTIKVYQIEDYITNTETMIAETRVEVDSSFLLSFHSPITQKIVIKANNNKGYIYVQPNGNYDIYFPANDKFDPYRPSGNLVEVAFFNLDSTDINYKILSFQRWMDDFIGNYYHLKSSNTTEFAEALDRFKTRVENYYIKDSLTADTSFYLKTFVRFSIAGLDNIQQAADRNRYEKHDFYIKNFPVQYKNDAYMEYISGFYQQMMPRLSLEANEMVYNGIMKSSPTVIMKALGTEYTLKKINIREIVMMKMLGEMYPTGEFPQSNIMTILDSLESNALIPENRRIAANMKVRLTELTPGSKAPEINFDDVLVQTKNLADYNGKHVYIHFADVNSENTMRELPLLIELHKKYGDYIQFITVFRSSDQMNENNLKEIRDLKWDTFALDETNKIWNNYKIETFPTYVLIDAAGYIVAAPALKPTPNGQYETIDKTFFYIRKYRDEGH